MIPAKYKKLVKRWQTGRIFQPVNVVVNPTYENTLSKDELYILQQGICWICLKKMKYSDISKDHLIPKSRGGGYGINILLAHKLCNSKRGAPDISMTPAEFRKYALERIRNSLTV